MQEFIDLLFQTRSTCVTNRSRLAAKYNISDAQSPIDAFGMIYNVVTGTLEHAFHYSAAWGNPASLSNDTMDGKQKLERLMLISKTMFIWSMSAIEFSSKDAIESFPGVLIPNRPAKDVYFGEIVKLSADSSLISESKRPLWFGANKVRNRLVHNNGIANESLTVQFSNDLSVIMREGKPMEGNMMMFPRLTFWIAQEYADWCDKFLSRKT